MGNYIFLEGVENPRRGGQGRNLTTNVPKILDLKSSSERIFSKNCRWVPLVYEEMSFIYINTNEIPNHFTSTDFGMKGAIYYVAIPTVIFSHR